MKCNICAIIVTRNRYEKLKRCLQALEAQTYLVSSVIVVDNESTDRTKEYLQELSHNKKFSIIFQKNLGGAGGFYSGLRLFLKMTADWAWLMDDDGWPDSFALQRLQPENQEEPKWRNSLVIDEKNHKRLAFGLWHNGSFFQDVDDLISIYKYIPNCNPFNGTLLHRELIKKIGLPLKELFLKGDETEYINRAVKFDYKIATVTSSFFFHPEHREKCICKTSDERVWVFFYKVRNIDALGAPDGTFSFNCKSSYKYGIRLSKQVLNCMNSNELDKKKSFYRLFVIWSGVVCAFFCLPLRLFSSE